MGLLTRRATFVPLAAATLWLLGVRFVAADEPHSVEAHSGVSHFESGLKVGAKVPQFYVRAVSGAHQNKSVCYVCRNGDRPVVMLIARDMTPELTQLLQKVDALVDQNRAAGLRGFGVFLPQEGKELFPKVQTLAFNAHLSMPLTIATTATEGPSGQEIHPDASLTVILYRDQTVTANFAYRAGQLDAKAIEAILKSTRELAGIP